MFKNKTLTFWVRFVLWFGFAIGTPFFAVLSQYDFLDVTQTLSTQVSGWAIVIVIIIVVFAVYILTNLFKAIHHPFLKQLIWGFLVIILPMIAVYLLTGIISRNADKIRFILAACLIGESLAIPINPLPQFVYEMEIIEMRKKLNGAKPDTK